MKKWTGKWLMDPAFKGLEPINVFHKELCDIELPEHREDLKNRHMLVRKSFHLKKRPKKASVDITGDDYYKLYINGMFLGQGPAPAYHFAYNYNTYDIADFLQEGENVIAVHVYYQGLINRVWNSGDYRQGLIAEITADDSLVVATDDSWKYSISEAYESAGITGYDTQYLESFDSRLWDTQWRNLGYDDSSWDSLIVNAGHDYTLQKQVSDNLQVYSIASQRVEKIAEGHYFIDFGQEITGQLQLTAKGPEGHTIEIRCGEELIEGETNRVRYNLRCNCTYQDYWILSGEKDTLELFDYKAFRYAEVITPQGTEINRDIRAVVRHYPFDEANYQFTSSNEMVNKVIEVCRNGVRYGTQEVFVDCPTREKGQYLGDFTVTGHSHIYLTGDTAMYKKTLMDFATSAHICPGLMAVAPGGYMQEIADFSLQWPMQLWQYYRQTGDKVFLEEMYPVVVGIEDYFEQFRREDGLLISVKEKWNLVDWPDNLRDGYDYPLTKPIGDECHNVINAFHYGMAYYTEEIRSVLDLPSRHNLKAMKESFVKVFYNSSTGLFVDREESEHSAVHSNVLPLFFDLFPSKDVVTAVTVIKERAHLTGVYMSYFLLKGLAEAGEHETVFKLIEQLWSTMVEEGATTCFEAWGKDQKFNTSLCHPWASAPISILVEDIMGLNPAEPGWGKVHCLPRVPASLETFRFQVTVKTGTIIMEKSNNTVRIKATDGIVFA